MTAENANPNGRNRLLGSLAPVDFALLFPHLKEVHFELGTLLQEAGDPMEMVYFPQTGMISLLAVMEAGDGVETATIGREGAVNTMVGLGGRRAAGRAVVQVEGTSSQILTSRFQGAMDESPSLKKLIVRYNDAQMSGVYQSVGCNARHRVEARLCRWLLQTRDRSGTDVLSLTQEFLAEMLGVQRTTVTLLARQLQDAGVIRYRRGRVEIVDRSGLERRACDCYATVRRQIEHVFS
jgi:CRP-like cAMP-binding protein